MGNIKRNIMLLALSPIPGNQKSGEYVLGDSTTRICTQTNEAPIHDVIAHLRKSSDGTQKLDAVYMLVTKSQKNKTLPDEEHAEGSELHKFWKKQQEECPGLPEWPTVIWYDDAVPEQLHESTLRCVNETLRRVLQDVEQQEINPDECQFFVDITGAYRPAAMVLLQGLQLLQYAGFRLGKVVYSQMPAPNDGHPLGCEIDFGIIDGIFKLISGADAFVKYGSAQGLEEFFDNGERHSAELDNLLNCMSEFADVIRLCQTGKVEASLENLEKAIESFAQCSRKAAKEAFFAQLLSTIRREYEPILTIKGGISQHRLEIIKWCINKEFAQQALTFCTEWIPAIIVEKGICYPASWETVKKRMPKNGWKNEKLYFVNDYLVQHDVKKEQLFYQLLNNYVEGTITIEEFGERLQEEGANTTEFENLLKRFEMAIMDGEDRYTNIIYKDRQLCKLVKQMWLMTVKTFTYDYGFSMFCNDKVNDRKLLKSVGKSAPITDNLEKFFALTFDKNKKSGGDADENEKLVRILHACRDKLEAGLVHTTLKEKGECLEIIEKYQSLRTIYRNSINHAGTNTNVSSSDLNGIMEALVKKLEKA